MALTKASNFMMSSPPVSVLDYGADPTGSADSTAAIQAAIDSSNATNGIFFPAGTYLLTSALNITKVSGKRLLGAGMRTTILNFSGVTGHGLDMTGADQCEVCDMQISTTGGTPQAGVLMARTAGWAGGFLKFSRVRIIGWDVCFYSYGSELNYYDSCQAIGKVALFSNASNPLGYTSTFCTIATGGQSNTYLTWIHGQIESTAALDATYDAALVLEDVNSCNFYNPIFIARGLDLGSNVQIRSFAKNVAFFGGRIEVNGAIGFKCDNTSVNRLVIENIDVAPSYPNTFVFVGKGSTGNVSGLTILGCGLVSGSVAKLVDLDICVGALLDATNTTLNVGTRFSGIVVEGTPSTWTLPVDQQGVVVANQAKTYILNNPNGSATFSGSGTVAVTFSNNEPDTNYRVSLAGNANQTFWVTSKSVSGFTINSSNGSSSATVDWVVTR